jgi:hypothetical protein
MSKNIVLYHATCISAYEKILINGIGLDKDDYKNILNKLSTIFPLENKLLDRFFNNFYKHNNHHGELNGGVSFFPKFITCAKISLDFNSGGEFCNLFILHFVRYWCRVTKVKLTNEIKQIALNLIYPNRTPCIIVFDVPDSFIENDHVIGTSSEHYTYCKVPPQYILHCFVLGDKRGKPVWLRHIKD